LASWVNFRERLRSLSGDSKTRHSLKFKIGLKFKIEQTSPCQRAKRLVPV
jgi:hypothetical protein